MSTDTKPQAPKRRIWASPDDVADYLWMTKAGLAKWRMTPGDGPSFYRIGHRIRYDWDDVFAWESSRKSTHVNEYYESKQKASDLNKQAMRDL